MLGPHLEYSLRAEGHRCVPRPFRMGVMTYMTRVESPGGITIVWPGTHLTALAWHRSEPERFRCVADLSRALGRREFGEARELLALPGDVLLHDSFLIHADSGNLRAQPRLALNQKW